MVHRLPLACVLFLLFCTIHPTRAASPTTLPSHGTVKSIDGHPIAGATVWTICEIHYLQQSQVLSKTTTKPDGSFDLPTPPPMQEGTTLSFVVRADGFGISGATRSFDVVMAPAVPVTVKLQRPDGKPIAGVKVSPLQLAAMRDEIFSASGWHIRIPDALLAEFAVASNADGIATLSNLPQNARVNLRALDEAYARSDFDERIIVPKSADPTPVPVVLLAGGAIEGRVIGNDGKPVAGVYVSAQATDASGGTTSGSDYTDDEGRYALKQMRPAAFNVAIGLAEPLSTSWTAVAYESLTLVEGQRVTGKDFQLIPGTLITGKVADADTGKPLAGLSVGVYGPAHPKSSGWVQGTKSGIDGTYRLRVPPGNQYVYLMSSPPEGYEPTRQEQSKEVTVTETEGATVDFSLRRDKNPPVAGRVVDAAGKPVAQAKVTLETPASDTPMFAGGSVKTTDEQGRFVFAAVPPGSILRAAKGRTGTLTPVPVDEADADIMLTVEEGYLTSIAGVVTDLEGKPIPGAMISLSRMQGQYGIGSEPRPTDAQGRYNFDDLPVDGKYSVSAFAKGYGEAQSKVPLTASVPTEAPALKLPRADSFVGGRVVDGDGKPVAGITVYLMTNSLPRPETVTDHAGNFRFDAVVAGKPVTVYTAPGSDPSRFAHTQAKPGKSDAILTLRTGPAK